jgi:hypothetical protein
VPNCSSGGLSVDAVNLLKEHCRYDWFAETRVEEFNFRLLISTMTQYFDYYHKVLFWLHGSTMLVCSSALRKLEGLVFFPTLSMLNNLFCEKRSSYLWEHWIIALFCCEKQLSVPILGLDRNMSGLQIIVWEFNWRMYYVCTRIPCSKKQIPWFFMLISHDNTKICSTALPIFVVWILCPLKVPVHILAYHYEMALVELFHFSPSLPMQELI